LRGFPRQAACAPPLCAIWNYRDAWSVCYPERSHALTCGLSDHAQGADGPDCRDFIFVSEDMTSRVRRVEVNGVTDASDHQPILIELADEGAAA